MAIQRLAPDLVAKIAAGEVVDVFAPPREDFLTGDAPAYMRQG